MTATDLDSASLCEVFATEAAMRVFLEGGGTVFARGSAPDSVFLVESGRLLVIRPDSMGQPMPTAIVRPGEIVGEMAALSAQPHGSTVIAMRDTRLRCLPTTAFFKRLEHTPMLGRDMARLVLERSRATARGVAPVRTTVIGVTALCGSVATRPLAEGLASSIRLAGFTCCIIGVEGLNQAKGWLDLIEQSFDYVLLVAEVHEHAWSLYCERQVDRLYVVARAEMGIPSDCPLCERAELIANRLVTLILVRSCATPPAGSRAIMEQARASSLFHVRENEEATLACVARSICNRNVALVMSGGGARAFAHIGVVRALREAGIGIDAVGGTSMGAIIAAAIAKGWSDSEIDGHMRDAFVTSNPLDDIALPLLAMTRGRKVEKRLIEHFGEVDIPDLPIPFFCTSADLTSGSPAIHDSGPLAHALRASISLPGVLPPVIAGDSVLVDGGVLGNLPTGIMRARHAGMLIASDVTRTGGLGPSDLAMPDSWLQWFRTGAWRRGPPIVSVLMRSATVPSQGDWEAARANSDIYVMPTVDDVDLRDWKAYDRAVEAGYSAGMRALATLSLGSAQASGI